MSTRPTNVSATVAARRRWLCAALASLAALASPLHAADAPGARDPVIVEVRSGRLVAPSELAQRLADVRYRLLGEVHDNAAHHDARARLIRDIAARGVKPAVALEVFDLDRADGLRAAQAEGRADAQTLADRGGLDQKSWRWPMHRPPIEAALAAGLPVRAANLSRAELQRAMRAGVDAGAGTPWAARLADARWTPEQEAALEASIVEGHCGKLPASAASRIARAQRERDAAMAQAVVDAATPDGTIVLAGNGHVRNDIGVPVYLPAGSHVSVGFVETGRDVRTADARRAELDENPGYDFVWFTAGVDRPDPCAQLPADIGKPR